MITSAQDRISAFGYDPNAGLQPLGSVKDKEGHWWDMYFNPASGAIDVCHFECNRTSFRGRLQDDGSTTLSSVQDEAFLRLRASLCRQKLIGTVSNLTPGWTYHLYLDDEEGRINGYVGPQQPGRTGYFSGFIKNIGQSNERIVLGGSADVISAFRKLLSLYRGRQAGCDEVVDLDWSKA
jgi:hypothetical protein